MRVEILAQKGNLLKVRYDGRLDVDTYTKNKKNGRFFGELEPWIKGTTTDRQRKHYWAIIKDISNHLGFSKGEARLHTYSRFMFDNDRDDFISVARNKASVEDANLLIQSCIDFGIDHDVPFNNDYSEYFTDKQFYAMTMKRMCWVCGDPGDIAHVEAVGAGRNRRHIDHTQHNVMCLCRKHHTMQHQMGIDSFFDEFKIKHGLILSKEDLRELGVM